MTAHHYVSRWLRLVMPALLGSLLVLTACTAAPSKYDQVQQDTTGFRSEKAVDRQAVQGSTFNPFFPATEGEYQVVPAQEKKGFAEYKLKQGDKTLAMLTINDTISLPAAAEKYANATIQIGGYPAVNQGTTTTGLLVNGRYQVKVLSRDPEFSQADREAWLEKFDLNGLAAVKADQKPEAKRPNNPPQFSTQQPSQTPTLELQPAT